MRKYIVLALFVALFVFVVAAARGAVSAGPAEQDSPPTAGEKGEEAANTAEVEIISVGETDQTAVSDFLAPNLILGQSLVAETEPNNSVAEANTISGSDAVILGNNYPASDVDFYSFTAGAGDRVYAAAMTSFSASSVNSIIDIYASDGTTILETDLDDGSLGSTSSSIAGTVIPSSGTYYIRLRDNGTSQIRPYHLHFRLQSGLPAAEVEPNDTSATAQPLPASGWITAAITATTDIDWYSLSLNAGDTVYASLDLDPTRDNTQWNGRLGIGIFSNFILVVNDATAGSATNPLSEAHLMTAQTAGTYYIYVDAPDGIIGDYQLSVTVHPAEAQSCTTYTSTDTPILLPTGPGLTTSTITIPGNPRISDLNATINLTHTLMVDLDITLMSPAGNENGLVTDVGNSTAASTNIIMNLGLDDEAGMPAGIFTVVDGMVYQPELNYRLAWFDGEDAGGTWTLNVRDDLAANGGILQGWSLTVCEPPPLPVCPNGTVPTVLYSNGFETSDGGFTHSGVQDEWERGLPTFAPITSCNGGSNCWKTDLDNTYNASSSQDLLSPGVVISGTGVVGPVYLSWAQKYQIETTTFDHAFVDVQQVGGSSPTRLWEWLDNTMTTGVGNPTVTIQESAGWGVYTKDISSYLGQNTEVRFHIDGDSSVHLGGLAIDDVSITACAPAPAATITLDKTVGTNPAVCAATDTLDLPFFGDEVTYCYTVTNTGNVALTVHSLVDNELGTILNNFPYTLTAGASTFITVTTPITQTTTNEATWTATDGVTTTASAMDTAVVNVPVPLPSVNMTKTVGTNPAECATTSSVTLPVGGGDVTYCYEIENTGNITLTNHNLTDNELGAILTNYPYTLAPGSSTFLTQTVNITQTTVNTAIWTADLPGAPVTVSANDSDTAVVNVELAGVVCNTYDSTDVPIAIVDLGTATSQLNVPNAGTITDINVLNIAGTHTWVSDLEFYITSPDSTQVQLQDNICGSQDNFDINYDDEATPGTPPCPPTDGGTYQPFQPLSALDGGASDGDWIFSVTDIAGGDTGFLNSWSVEVCYVPAAGPSIELAKTVGTDPGVCASTDAISVDYGTDVTYCYEVTNTGTVTLTSHTLVDDQLGTLLTGEPIDLAPGASYAITETTTLTETTVNLATWTATNGTDTAVASDSATVTVVVTPTIDVSPTSLAATQAPNSTSDQTLSISNIGSGNLDWTIAEEGPTIFGRPSEAVFIFGLPAVAGNSSRTAAETVANAVPTASNMAPPAAAPWSPSGGILYDNGPLVNSPGTGAGGADESLLQDTSLGMGTYGFGHQIPNNNSMADDFTVTGSPWTVDSMVFYAYQTGSSTTSTITGYNVDIYDGDPSSGGTVIASSSTIINSEWSGIYRGLESAPGATNRPIMATTIDFGGLVLAPGTYWVEWQAAGSLASGPWAPPITINGQTATGNGLQNLAGTWGTAVDVGQQGFPFLVMGTAGAVVCSTPSDVPWLSVSPTAGITGAGETSDVTVTFDSTGLIVGNTYTATLCVESNDAVTPLVTVPVSLTVEGAPAIVVAPAALGSTQLADTQVTQPLTISNTGGVSLDWDIYEDNGDSVRGNSWADNFDSYATGSQMHGQGGWKGWNNDPAAGALTSATEARSVPNSVAIQGPSDLVHEYSGFTSGQYVYTAWQYIPSSSTGQTYFILLNTYVDNGTNNWSTQVCFDSATDLLYDAIGGTCTGASTLSIVYDQWVQIRVEIDLDADTQAFYYDNQLLFQDTWTGHVSGSGTLNIGAVDLFANGASDVYYDDLSLAPPSQAPCVAASDIPWASVSPDNGSTAAGGSSTVDVTFDSTGLAANTYTGTLCVESNDPAAPLVEVPLTLTVEEAVYGVAVTAVDDALSGTPGSTVTYTVWVTNTGNAADTFDLSISGNTWTSTPSASSVSLDPGDSTTVSVAVDIPANAVDGDTDTATMTATSTGDGTVSGSTDLTTTAVEDAVYAVSLSPDDAADGAPGDTITYTVWITNDGNVADTFDLSLGSSVWSAALSAATITLNEGESGSVTVAVSIAANAADGDVDSVTVTAVSQNDATATASTTLTTTAQQTMYGIYLPVISKP